MKKSKKLLITASLVSTAVTMGGCRFLPWMNETPSVYGPPPDEYVTATPVSDFDAEENVNAGVYGPPPEEEVTPEWLPEKETETLEEDGLTEG